MSTLSATKLLTSDEIVASPISDNAAPNSLVCIRLRKSCAPSIYNTQHVTHMNKAMAALLILVVLSIAMKA